MPRARSPRVTPTIGARLLAAAGLTVLLGGLVAVVVSSNGTEKTAAPPAGAVTAAATTTTRAPVRPRTIRITATGAGAYDPEGDRSENDADAGLATDGNRATAWKSERYRSTFTKSGVGVVLDARRSVRPTRVTVVTETPGYKAQVRIGRSRTGPFTPVSGTRVVTGHTTFTLRPSRGRYLLLWITSMPPGGTAAVNEVVVAGRG